MKSWLYSLVINKLLRDLELPAPERDKMDIWLAAAWMTPGFRQYIAYRDSKIVFDLAGGVGMLPEPRQNYTQKFGQRVEILLLGKMAKEAWERKQKQEAALRSKEQVLHTKQ